MFNILPALYASSYLNKCFVLFFPFPEPLGEATQALSDSDQTPDKNKKKNRCFSCRKKVGLTGKDNENFAHSHISSVESSS